MSSTNEGVLSAINIGAVTVEGGDAITIASITANNNSALNMGAITCGSAESPIEGNCVYVGTSVNGDIYVEDSI